MGRHQFEGTLTDLLLGGGAYGKFQGSTDEARQITRECVDSAECFPSNVQTIGALYLFMVAGHPHLERGLRRDIYIGIGRKSEMDFDGMTDTD